MATLMAEITDDLQKNLDREFASGRFKDRNALVQVLLEAAIRMKWKEDLEDKIDEGLAEIERGDFVPHKKGDCGKMGREYLQEKREREAKP
jgi:predicted transcriptional regulator